MLERVDGPGVVLEQLLGHALLVVKLELSSDNQ
jgi:hypothetical protein